MLAKARQILLAVLVALWVAKFGWCDQPVDVTVCQLKANPPAYNHKLIRVTGFVSHAYEDFTIFDPECSSWPDVWLEYGGRVGSGTIYLGSGRERTRPEPLVVEGLAVGLVLDK